MNLKYLFILYSLFLSIPVFGQKNLILKSDGKLKQSEYIFSEVIEIIPAGNQVKIISGPSSGIYKVRYNGKTGYINEIYFERAGIGGEPSKLPKKSNQISSPKTNWKESEIKNQWSINGMEEIEGIYESVGSYSDVKVPCTNAYGQTLCYMTWRNYEVKYKVALVKANNDYKLIYLSGSPRGSEKVDGCNCDGKRYIAPANNKWISGEVKARLYKTATPDFYKCDWYMGDKSLNSDS